MGAHIGLLDDPPGLAEDGGGDEDLLADHGVVLVVGVVGVAELAVGAELELEELVPELALVPHVVPQVELAVARGAAVVAAARRHRFFFLSPFSVSGLGFSRGLAAANQTCWPPLLFLLGRPPTQRTLLRISIGALSIRAVPLHLTDEIICMYAPGLDGGY